MLPSAAAFELPSKKRGWVCVTANLHTPLSPLFRGESYKIEIPIRSKDGLSESNPSLCLLDALRFTQLY